MPEQILTHEIVTLWYPPSGVLLNAPTYDTALDIWSFGCVLAEITFRQPLFRSECEIDQLLFIFRLLGLPRFPLIDLQLSRLSMSGECRQFLKDILIYNPKDRRTARQLLEEHEYLTEAAILAHTVSKKGLIARPIRTIIDLAIRQ
ncbi:unnamed protein product [Rotaria sp. Silwood2]|nr:unnamed protein product [Rotaria sp. Silwood2]